MRRSWFAPGKVVVAGEYAVVDGAPAIVAAVGLGVAVDVDLGAPFAVRTSVGDTRFVDAALAAVPTPPAAWSFRDAGGPPLASKPGLGGSAAATVVAVHAARELAGLPEDPEATCATATAVHRAVQGSGSGVDVAASTYGGVLRFVRDAPIQRVRAPRLVVVWSGASAATGPRVGRYLGWSGREAFVRRSTEIVDAFEADPIGAIEANRLLLEAMADAAGIAYRTEALDGIVALARAHGGAAKPSGAGGGDCAVAVLPDAAAEEAFVAACGAAGRVVLAREVAKRVGRQG